MDALLFLVVEIIPFELPMMNHKKNDQLRLRHFEERQLQLENLVAEAERYEYSYDDVVSDITEVFSSGEKMERNPESLGSSSKSLTGCCQALSTKTRYITRRKGQMSFQIMLQRTTTCFCRC